MAPHPAVIDQAAAETPILLNEKFKVHSYNGGCFKSRAQYDIKNVLVPVLETFHCSGSGTKFSLMLQCTAPEDFTLTHFYVSGPGPRCTEPIRSGLVWVTDESPETEALKKYDCMSSEELMEIMKGLRQFDEEPAKTAGLPEPCVYFTTDPNSRESEVELSKWREGKYVTIKFLDTHKDQVNIDVGIVGLIGFFGRRAKQQVPFGPWMRRTVRQSWVHPNPLKSTFSSSGWVCDGRDFTGGCRSGQTDFHQTNVYTVTFRCTTSGFDLCERCAHDPSLGKVTDASLQSDLEALADPATCKLAVMRLRNLWRRDWPTLLNSYFQHGFLDVLVQALHKSIESSGRPDEERVAVQRQQGPEAQKRQMRRALLQLTAELAQRLFCIGPGGDLSVNDLVWGFCTGPDEHWDGGRLVQLPKATADSSVPAAAVAPVGELPGETPPTVVGGGTDAAADQNPSSIPAATTSSAEGAADPSCFLVSWRAGQPPTRVQPRNIWKMTANEDVMMATASLMQEVSKGAACDCDRAKKLLDQGPDLQATNGEGCTVLLAAVKSEAPMEVLNLLLQNGACPDVTGRNGATPLRIVMRQQAEGNGNALWLQQCAESLKRHGATVPDTGVDLEETINRLRETFGLKMVGSLLTLQSPLVLPVEVLEVLHLLFRELPMSVVRQALEPQAFRALTALLQHFVGGTDSLSTAVIGCRVMRALSARPDPTLQYLVRSHGAVRWAQRLTSAKDVAQCGLYRQLHHEKVTSEELNKEAKALLSTLLPGGAEASAEHEEWRGNARLVEIVTALEACDSEAGEGFVPTQEALHAMRELLKKTEKGNLLDDRCAAYELEKSNLPGLLLRFLKFSAQSSGTFANAVGDGGVVDVTESLRHPPMNMERWGVFREAFSDHTKHTRKGLGRLIKALHFVLETGEVFPVWKHKRERGLRALTEPLNLRLKAFDAENTERISPLLPQAICHQLNVSVEPLVPLATIARYLLRVTPCIDEEYLKYCHTIVGATIVDPASCERSVVVAFEVLHAALPLPVHTVRNAATGENQRVLLSLRDYYLLENSSKTVAALDFRVALCRLHAIGGFQAYPALLEDVGRVLRGEPVAQAVSASAPMPAAADASGTPASKDGSPEVVPDASGDGSGSVGSSGTANANDTQNQAAAAAAARAAEAAQQIVQQAVATVAGRTDEGLAVLAEEILRVAPPKAPTAEGDGNGGEAVVDPSMRVHTVMISVSEEIPFELFWPMVRDDIMGAVRELYPRSVLQMEESVQAGVSQNGMGPIAQRLTLEEAEMLAARVGHVVQTVVTVDAQAVQDLRKERTKTPPGEAIPIAGRIQFSPKSRTWAPGVVIGHVTPGPAGAASGQGETFDIIDEQGMLWEKLPRARLRMPPQRRETPGLGGMPIQAVLSQADLVRIREHLRRRREESAERHAQLSGNAGAVAGGGGVGSDSALGGGGAASQGGVGSGGTNDRPMASRPTSAPVVAQRPRTSSQGAIEAPASGSRRGVLGDLLSSREGSLGEVDAGSAFEMVHFIDDEGIGDEDFDDDGDGPHEGDDGEEDDEDLPPMEPSEAGDSQAEVMAPPRLGIPRSQDGEPREDGGSSMEEELRVLEQLRAMEQIISEVLDPQDGLGGGGGRARRAEAGNGHGLEDFLGAPMANLRIRMGGGSADGRVETYQIRRASGSRGSERGGPGGGGDRYVMEALRGDFPAFVRAADATNPTSSLDHPVVDRLRAADLVEDNVDEPMEGLGSEMGFRPPQLMVRFSLQPPAATTISPPTSTSTSTVGTPAAAAAPADLVVPMPLPPAWNLLKAMQFLQDQQYLKNQNEAGGQPKAKNDAAATSPPCVVQALQKVSLDSWGLYYTIEVANASIGAAPFKRTACADEAMSVNSQQSPAVANMEVDSSQDGPTAIGRSPAPSSTGLPARKRRRMLSTGQESVPDEVARELYSALATNVTTENGGVLGPHSLIAKCGDNSVVTDAIELLHLLRAQGSGLGVEPSLWISSKLDRKLRYQLEDPLSVVSGTLPFWATTLPRLCPFLFSLKTRKMLLKYTAFGPSFAVHWTQESKVGSFLRRRATVQTELNAQTDPRKIQELSQELSNIEEHVVKSTFWLGTLQSTLVRMEKGEDLLRQSDAAMELVSASSNLVEVQFDGETGFGSAVTQSFYVEVAQALQNRETNRIVPMWVEDDDSTNSQFLLCRRGLLFRPLVEGPTREEAVRRFRFLGRLMGQALREGFIVPLPLADEVFAMVLGEPLGPSSLPRPGGGTVGELLGVLADFSAEMDAAEAAFIAATPGHTPEDLAAWRTEQVERTDFGDRFLAQQDRVEGAPSEPLSFNQYVALVGASFLETGLSGAPLCHGGDAIAVTADNMREFVQQASRFWFDTGVSAQIGAFRAGLNDVFPFECLAAFDRSELREMFCGEDRVEWDEQALLSHLHPIGGLTDKSPTYKFLVEELLEMGQTDRSRFLDFVSSCPRLPPGGISKFHVDVFPDTTATQQGFPRSRACANQLYLPPYTSRKELHEKLHEAMHCSAGHHEQRVRDQ